MKVYVVFHIKNSKEEVIGVCGTPQDANKLLDGRYGYFCEYDTTLTQKSNNDLTNIRVLQHDTEDQIRIGMAYPVFDLDKAEQVIIRGYEDRTAWCGGFKVACERYYKRIAIVSADTLEVIRSIYERKE